MLNLQEGDDDSESVAAASQSLFSFSKSPQLLMESGDVTVALPLSLCSRRRVSQ